MPSIERNRVILKRVNAFTCRCTGDVLLS